MELELGDLAARYRLEEVVGEGGMGRVFRAFDTSLQRRVAIKVLRSDRSPGGSEVLARMLKEARLAAALEHPGAVAIYDVNEDPQQPFIVMEFVAGRSLRELVGAPELPLSERLRWLIDVAKTLAAAHRVGLVHRDLKPENVMLGDDGRVKLLDFGVASRISSEPERGEGLLAGTPHYMAPEQLQRRPVDARVDQFAWGVLAYELLCGSLPWRSLDEGGTTTVAVVTERQERLSERQLDVPVGLAAIVDRALEKLPTRRFESMDALVRALEAEPPLTESTPSTPAERERERERGTPGPLTSPTLAEAKPEPEFAAELLGGPLPRRAWRMRAAVVTLTGAIAGLTLLDGSQGTTPPHAEPEPEPEPELPWKPGPDARAAYDEGMRRFEGAAVTAGRNQLELAVEYEPEFAAAHLRLAFIQMADGPHENARDSFHSASRLRRRLSSLDRELLDAIAPAFTRDPPALDEVAQALERLAARQPEQLELAMFHAVTLAVDGEHERALEAYRALLDDPDPPALAWLALAYTHGDQGHLDAAQDALRRCLEQAPDAIDCYWYRLKLDAHMGRCAQMEAGARAWTELGTVDHGAPLILMQALVARHASEAELELARAEARARMNITQQTAEFALFDSARAILVGELEAADAMLAKLPSEVALGAWRSVRTGELRVALREELGDLPGAAAIASDFLRRRASLSSEPYDHEAQSGGDPTMYFNAVRFAAGELRAEELESKRRDWIAARRERGTAGSEEMLWLRAHAQPARSPAQARAAIAAIADPEQLVPFIEDRLFAVEIAHVFLLAGRTEAAVPLLRQACASCLAILEPLRFVQAHLLLGQALEQEGDSEGACAAYEVVLQRWGAAPRSVSASQARRRWEALTCEPG